MNYHPYQARRVRLAELLPDKSMALIGSGTQCFRNADANYAFRVDSSFWYLTGFDEPDAFLAIRKAKGQVESQIFVPPADPAMERWNGRRLGVDGAAQLGCDKTFANNYVERELGQLLGDCDSLWVLFHQKQIKRMTMSRIGQHARHSAAPHQLCDLGRLIYQMRWIKDEHELDLLRNAAAINSLAHIQAMRQCAPGRYEYHLAGAHLAESFQHGVQHQAYLPIAASAANACVLHYTSNTRQMQQGDLVLVDAGCEYGYYASDVTRTYPVSGTFTPLQQELYELVLQAQLEAIELARPGNCLSHIHRQVVHRLTRGLLDMHLLKGSFEQCLEENHLERFYMHGTSHWLGLDVHDPSAYQQDGEEAVLRPGAVLTVEPGLYFDAQDDIPEALHNTGIRIEDDVVITADQPEVLTVATPKLPDDMCAVIGCATGRR